MAAGANINGLIDPIVGVTTGPEYALTLNNNFDLIDSHDHSVGNGAFIDLSNLAVTSDFSMGSKGFLNLSKIQLVDATSLSVSSLRSVYAKGNDLYFYNGSGLDIQITNASGVAAASGNISGLIAPASASFASNTITFNSTATTPANVELGDVIFHNSSSLTYKLTLKAPTLSSNVIQTLPSTPTSSTSFVTMDTSGAMATNISTTQGITTSLIADLNVTTAKIADLNVTTAKIADLNVTSGKIADGAITSSKKSPLNIQISGSSGVGSITGSTYQNIPNLSVTITTNSRPIFLTLISDGNPCYITPVSGTPHYIRIIRGASQICAITAYQTVNGLTYIDIPLSGTYVYTVQMNVGGGSNYANFGYLKLAAFEM